MTLAEIFALLSRRSIELRIENHTLHYQAPKGALTDELRKLLAERKDSIIACLEKRIATSEHTERIAVIGMAGRFPEAIDVNVFWQNLRNGIECIRHLTEEELSAMGVPPKTYNDPNFVKALPVLDDADKFDAPFFGYSPREAELIDPQHRIFLECAWHAMEDAGYNPERYQARIGVFGSAGPNYYGGNYIAKVGNVTGVETYQLELGNENDYLATRVAYKMDFKGPAMTIQTACSSSLVAAHIACQNLLSNQCDIALAGGVSINARMKGGYLYQEGLISSPDGHCRAFDAKAKGTVLGQGAGVVVLKRLSEAIADGDNIYAVIRGSAINNDGADKIGFTAPSINGQSEVILATHSAAGLTAEDIGYIEAHGTGTPLGDPIEIKALTRAFQCTTDRKGYCPIGSVKTNIGHLDAAAGVAGLIKIVLMLSHGEIPPSLHFEAPNPNLNLEDSPFFVNAQLKTWQGNGLPRRAGVSSFGLGGTNAHMILEEAPEHKPSEPAKSRQILSFSSRSEEALNVFMAKMADYLKQHPEVNLADVAYTLQVGRKAFARRHTFVCGSTEEAATALRSVNPGRIAAFPGDACSRELVFMFSGQGSQYVNMGLGLYHEEPSFREQIDFCTDFLHREYNIDLIQHIYPSDAEASYAEEALKQTAITQIALFVFEYALARLWISWGVTPQAFVGHSIGEYVAACLAGVFSLEDALRIVTARGRLMQEMPRGSMLAVFLSESQLASFMNESLSMSVINNPSICVVSGEHQAIDNLEAEFTKKHINSRRLHTSHAFHSKMMDPVLAPFIGQFKQIDLKPPIIPFVSNLTGTWITDEEATNPEYWAKHLRNTVRFADCLQELFKEPHRVLLEIGPGNTLSLLAHQHPDRAESHVILSSTRLPNQQQSDSAYILESLGALWCAGLSINWERLHAGTNRQRIPLPTYPFEHKRYWIEAPETEFSWQGKALGHLPERTSSSERIRTLPEKEKDKIKGLESNNKAGNHLITPEHMSRSKVEDILIGIWKELLGHTNIHPGDNFFALGGHSLVAIRLFARIENTFGKRLPLATLISSPTIVQLAELITRSDFKPSWEALVTIRSGGEKTPFFCIHSEGGNVLEYFKLASHMTSDRPFYGIQAYGLEGDKIISFSIEEMARHYVEEIKKVQPSGPYFLGGYCLGGLLAFEMTRQMESAGDEIAFLGMISTYSPDYGNHPIGGISCLKKVYYSVIERVELEIDNLSALTFKERFSYFGDRTRRFALICRVVYEDMADLLRRISSAKPYQHSRRYNLEQTRAEQAKAFYAFQPNPIKAPITLFRTSKQPRSLIFDPALGWANLSEKGVRTFEIHAFHKNILKEPKVKDLAQKLQACIDEAQNSLPKI